jgi:hypothetical protein
MTDQQTRNNLPPMVLKYADELREVAERIVALPPEVRRWFLKQLTDPEEVPVASSGWVSENPWVSLVGTSFFEKAWYRQENKETLTILEAANRLGLSYDVVREYVVRQECPYTWGPRRNKLIYWEDVRHLTRKSAAGRPRKDVIADKWLERHRADTQPTVVE